MSIDVYITAFMATTIPHPTVDLPSRYETTVIVRALFNCCGVTTRNRENNVSNYHKYDTTMSSGAFLSPVNGRNCTSLVTISCKKELGQ
jgi:hypothetical protein